MTAVASVLAGPVAVAAALLVAAGVAKLRRPRPAVASLRSVGLRVAPAGVRALGLGEVVAGAGALVAGGPVLVGAVAAWYAAFAAFVVASLARETATGCGCFGVEGPPPGRAHLAVDIAAAVAAGAGAATRAWPGLGPVLGDQPLAGIPFLVLAATGVALLRALLGEGVAARVASGSRAA